MDWIYEGRQSVYLGLAVASACLAGLWWRDRKAGWLVAIVPVALLALLWLLLDWSVETKAEQIARKLRDMAAAVGAKDAPRIVRHLSARFSYGGTPREAFGKHVEATLRDGWIDGLMIWDIKVEGDAATLRAKPKGGVAGDVPYIVRTKWAQDADREWRMQDFTVHNPFVDTDKPLDVPHLPR